MTLIGVGDATVGDNDRPVLQVACSTRGGFDGDVGGYAGDHESVDPRHSENGVEFCAVEPAGRLSPDERFTGPGGLGRR